MTVTDLPTATTMTEQELAEAFAVEGRRLAAERDTARRALRVERADHAETRYQARIEIDRLARRIADLERQLDLAQQRNPGAVVTAHRPLPDFGRRL